MSAICNKKRIYPENSVVMAPLSGYTDLPYRRILREVGGCRYCFTEMVDVASLAYANENTFTLLERGEEESWLGVQLVGSDLEHIKIAVDQVNRHHFDVLDFNLGCPVPKVAKKCAGAALGKQLDKALACFQLIAERSAFPVSAKIRILDETDPEPTLALVKGLSELGARAVTIHGRVMKAFYGGPVHTEIIKYCVEACPEIQIIANGGVMNHTLAAELQQASAADGIMVARGAMGNPWLFREIQEGEAFLPPTVEEWCEVMFQHVQNMIQYYGEYSAMRIARKIVLDYLRGRGFGGAAKNRASLLTTRQELEAFCEALRRGPAESYFLQAHGERALRRA